MPDTNVDDKILPRISFPAADFPFKRLLKSMGIFSHRGALFLIDLLAALLIFRISAGALNPEFFLHLSLKQDLALLVFPLLLIAFFTNYKLYDYYQIFALKRHFLHLLKSFLLSFCTIALTVLMLTEPDFLSHYNWMPVALFVILGVIVFSRLFSDKINSLIKTIGVSFLATGTIGIFNMEETARFIPDGRTLAWCALLTASFLVLTRLLCVQVVFNKLLRRGFRRQVVFVGRDREAIEITDHIIAQKAPFWVKGFVDEKFQGDLETQKAKGWLGKIDSIPELIRENRVDEIIITDETLSKKTLIDLLDTFTAEGVNVWFPPKLMPIIDMKLYIDRFCDIPMINLCQNKNRWLSDKIKYGLDALMTLPVFILLLPLFATIALAIKTTSAGSILYRPKAIGKNGRNFLLYKFRSMQVNSDAEIHKNYVTKLIKGEITQEGQNGQPLKITNDPRVTRVGNILRKLSLDELPQLINVLKGDMSLVGPRPCLPYEFEVYKDWHKKRTCIRPGISGLWQVAGRSEVTFEDMILLDLYYIYNRSVMMDINILIETVFVVLQKKGAY